MRKVKIYYLFDPKNKQPKYIGKTVSSLQKRLRDHISESKRRANTYKHHWINKLIAKGRKPCIELLEECLENNWKEREIYWISFFSNLTNSTPGGEGVSNPIKMPVFQYSIYGVFIKEYDSIEDAMYSNNFKKGTVDSAIIRSPEWCYSQGYIWRKGNLPFKKYVKAYVNHKNKPIVIVDLIDNTKQIFESLKEGIAFYNLPLSARKALDREFPFRHRYKIYSL